jgi:hypothetical protein
VFVSGVVLVDVSECCGVHRWEMWALGGGWCWREIVTLGVSEFFVIVINLRGILRVFGG